MGPFRVRLIPKIVEDLWRGRIPAVLIAGSLLVTGCGVYPSSGSSGALFASHPSDGSGRQAVSLSIAAPPAAEQAGNQSAPGGISDETLETRSGLELVGQRAESALSATVGIDAAQTAAVNPNGLRISNHLAVNINSLGRLRGHLSLLMPSTLTCKATSLVGGGTDNCTVSLNGISLAGTLVSLTSSNAAVVVPATVSVAKNAASATFTASISAVSSASTALVTAVANGGSAAVQLHLNALVPTLSASTSTINFGNVNIGQTATQSLTLSSTGTAPVTIAGISIAGSLFTVSGVATPLILNPGQAATLSVQFTSPHVSSFTGVVTISSNSSQGSLVVNMSAAGIAASGISALSCTAATIAGAGSDACTVTLTSAAPAGGLSVNLASSNSAVSVPASVAVAANATTAGFTANAAAVSSAQTATLTATASGTSKTFSLQLSPAGQGALGVNATSISFGNVVINDAATQSVTLSSTGTAAVTVSSAIATGTGFSVSGATFPLTLNAGQTATLNVQFDPTATGAAAGKLTIASNASTGATTTVSLSGTGSPHEVELTWNAPSSSSDPISGYRVYRAATGSSSYQLLNGALNAQTSYMDNTGQSGASYQYYVTSVDGSGRESVPSNTMSVVLP